MFSTRCSFFAMVAALFPLAVGPSPEQLKLSGPAVLWVAALLAMLLSLNSLFSVRLRGRQPGPDACQPGPAVGARTGQDTGALADQWPAAGRGVSP